MRNLGYCVYYVQDFISETLHTHTVIEIIYQDLADLSIFYCDYNITINIFCIHIGMVRHSEFSNNIPFVHLEQLDFIKNIVMITTALLTQ